MSSMGKYHVANCATPKDFTGSCKTGTQVLLQARLLKLECLQGSSKWRENSSDHLLGLLSLYFVYVFLDCGKIYRVVNKKQWIFFVILHIAVLFAGVFCFVFFYRAGIAKLFVLFPKARLPLLGVHVSGFCFPKLWFCLRCGMVSPHRFCCVNAVAYLCSAVSVSTLKQAVPV